LRSSPTTFVDSLCSALLRRCPPATVRAALDKSADRPAGAPLTAEAVFRSAGLTPDPWQVQYLADRSKRQLVLACRRAGKTAASAAKTCHHCLTTENAVAMVFSPTLRQSMEFTREVTRFERSLPADARPKRVRANTTEVEWANGARLLSLPDSPDGVVGFTPTWMIVDEAARASDELYKAIRPMLVLGASLTAISTPKGSRGWFFNIWNEPKRLNLFHHWRVTADHCPRITPESLEEERLEMGDRWFRQDFYCTFEDAVGAVFSKAVIDAAFDADVKPLWSNAA
jgi:phage FluMu gp28-like protein